MYSAKECWLALSVATAILTVSVQAADGGYYADSPAEGEFTGADKVSNDPYKAGEITVRTEGVLPPTEETVTMTSGGTEGNTYRKQSCVGINNVETEGVSDAYCVFNRGPPGTYLYNMSYSLTGKAETIDSLYTCGKYSASMSGRPYVDDGPPGRTAYFQPFEYGSEFFDNYYDVDVGGDLNERYVGQGYSVSGNTSKVADTYSTDAGTCRTREGKPTEHSKTREFRSTGSATLGYAEQCRSEYDDRAGCSYGPGDYYSNGGEEKLYLALGVGAVGTEVNDIVPEYSFGDGQATYITPVGNTYLDVDGRIFTGDSYSEDTEFSTTISDGSGNWQDTSKTIEIQLPTMPERPAGGVKKVAVKGEYWASSPPGVSPEGYRWVYSNDPSKVLISHTGLDSSDSGYRSLTKQFDQSSRQLPSGQYKLQIKSTADNYPVKLKQKNFNVERDSYIGYQEAVTFDPQLSLGENPISFHTRGSNNMTYRVQWTECHQPAADTSPKDGATLDSVNPVLSVTTGCKSLDKIEIRNANTDTLVKRFEDVVEGTKLEADSEVSPGEQYNWFVRFCDQGVCHTTDTYQFTVGGSGTTDGDTLSELDVSGATEGLDRAVRDEDFNALGQDDRGSAPLSQGYINKIEDSSDQLENGPKWKNSDGSEEDADQYAITPTPRWTVDNKGNIYPPPTNPQYRSTFYRDTSDRRTRISDPSIPKREKIFGNSLGVVAKEGVNKDVDNDGTQELVAREGAGVWIDPDQIDKTKTGGTYEYPQDWKQLLSFNIDITGPDSGLGYDKDSSGQTIYRENRKVAITDIYWQRES
jgi:hypothetical protein